MIHHFNQRVTADSKRYHTWLYVKCTMIYGHICTQIWRSVSASGHGNMILNKLPRPTRVRIRPREELGREFWGRFTLKNQIIWCRYIFHDDKYYWNSKIRTIFAILRYLCFVFCNFFNFFFNYFNVLARADSMPMRKHILGNRIFHWREIKVGYWSQRKHFLFEAK